MRAPDPTVAKAVNPSFVKGVINSKEAKTTALIMWRGDHQQTHGKKVTFKDAS